MNFLHPLFGKHRKRDKGGGGELTVQKQMVLGGRRGQRISKGGGGEISNVVVFKKILKNWPSRAHFQTTFCEKGGGRGTAAPPPLTAYARGIGLVQVILVLSFFHFCLKLSFVKSNRIILTETHVHKIPPPLSKVRPIHKQLLLFVSPGIQTWLYNSNANRILHIVITVNGRPIPKRSIMAIVEAPCSDKVKIDG